MPSRSGSSGNDPPGRVRVGNSRRSNRNGIEIWSTRVGSLAPIPAVVKINHELQSGPVQHGRCRVDLQLALLVAMSHFPGAGVGVEAQASGAAAAAIAPTNFVDPKMSSADHDGVAQRERSRHPRETRRCGM